MVKEYQAVHLINEERRTIDIGRWIKEVVYKT